MVPGMTERAGRAAERQRRELLADALREQSWRIPPPSQRQAAGSSRRRTAPALSLRVREWLLAPLPGASQPVTRPTVDPFGGERRAGSTSRGS